MTPGSEIALSSEWAGRDPRLAALHRLWQQKGEERSWPARRDFRHDDLRPWFGNLYLFDVLREPLDFRCRLFGTRLVEALRGDLTNKLLSQAPELIGLTQPEEGGAAADFRNCVRTREPRWHHGYWPLPDLSYLKGERLSLPLSNDGTTVDKIPGTAFFVAGMNAA